MTSPLWPTPHSPEHTSQPGTIWFLRVFYLKSTLLLFALKRRGSPTCCHYSSREKLERCTTTEIVLGTKIHKIHLWTLAFQGKYEKKADMLFLFSFFKFEHLSLVVYQNTSMWISYLFALREIEVPKTALLSSVALFTQLLTVCLFTTCMGIKLKHVKLRDKYGYPGLQILLLSLFTLLKTKPWIYQVAHYCRPSVNGL